MLLAGATGINVRAGNIISDENIDSKPGTRTSFTKIVNWKHYEISVITGSVIKIPIFLQ